MSEANADGVSAGDEADADSGGEPASVPDTGAATDADWWFASALTASSMAFAAGFLRVDISLCVAWSPSLGCGTDRETDADTDVRGGTVMDRGCTLPAPPTAAADRTGSKASRSSSPPSPSSSIKPISAASSALCWAWFQNRKIRRGTKRSRIRCTKS